MTVSFCNNGHTVEQSNASHLMGI